ncbi:MAG: efflux RND transporter periplasmic adaptor subunit [Bacteroidota bacterium]|nr:efflux RND transporter periplasmic adaptor subunit [Bacteroidota bacterium]
MKKTYALIGISLMLCCGKTSKQSASLLELNHNKRDLIQQIDSLSSLLKSVELNISKLDTNKRLTRVTALKSEKKMFQHFIEVQGSVEADQSVELYPESSGNITKIFVREGQSISKGHPLVQIDNSILESSKVELQTQLDLATTTFERQKRLWDQNIGSEIQYLQAKAKKEGLENSLESLKSQAKKLKITAPFSGTVDEIFVKTGGLANPMFPALRLINLNQIHVESEVTETYLKYIKKGTEVELYFPSIDKKINTKVDQVGNYINPNNRSFKVRINVNNTDGTLKANLLAEVKISDFKEVGIVIPSNLIQKDRMNKPFVYSLVKEDKFYRVKKSYIIEKISYENESFISEGLEADALIVDKGSQLVKEDETVILAE